MKSSSHKNKVKLVEKIEKEFWKSKEMYAIRDYICVTTDKIVNKLDEEVWTKDFKKFMKFLKEKNWFKLWIDKVRYWVKSILDIKV